MGELWELRQLRHQTRVAREGEGKPYVAGGCGEAGAISVRVFSVFLYPASFVPKRVPTNVPKTAPTGRGAGGSRSPVGRVSPRMAAEYGAGEQSARLHYFA